MRWEGLEGGKGVASSRSCSEAELRDSGRSTSSEDFSEW